MTPLELKILLEYYLGNNPGEKMDIEFWHSERSQEARQKFLDEDVLVYQDHAAEITEKGKAWVEYILATPMPVETTRWILPERSEEKTE